MPREHVVNMKRQFSRGFFFSPAFHGKNRCADKAITLKTIEPPWASWRPKGCFTHVFARDAKSKMRSPEPGKSPQGPDGPLYPGTCRHLDADERQKRLASGDAYALRLDVNQALQLIDTPLTFTSSHAVKSPLIRRSLAMWCSPAKIRPRAITSPS